MAVKGSVPQLGVIVPHLVVRDTAEALSFYERAFGATVLYRSPSPSGDGEHLHLKIWDSLVQFHPKSPRTSSAGWKVGCSQLLNRSVAPPVSSRFPFPTWTPHLSEQWMKVAAQRCPRRRCSGETGMDGSVTRSATCGL